MTFFFYILIAIITFIAFLHTYAKKSYQVSRTTVINAPRENIYRFVRQLRNQPQWVPWFKRDPDAVLKYKGDDGKEGAGFYWKGNEKVGEGTQKLVKAKPPAIIETRILFVKPIKVSALTYIAIKDLEVNKSKIVWGVQGYLPFPLSIISLIYSPERLLGKDFETGLSNLKIILEAREKNLKH